MKRITFLLIFILVTTINLPQTKLFTIEDVVINSYTNLAPKKLKQLSWIPNSNNLSYVNDDSVLVIVNSKNGNKIQFVNLSTINNFLKVDVLSKPFSKYPKINWVGTDEFTFWKNDYLISYSISKNKIIFLNKLSDGNKNSKTAPNNVFTAYTIENNLFAAIDTATILQLTNENNINIVSGQTVHRSEFGIKDGIFWSPNSNYLAFYQMDESMVTDYPLVEIGTAPAKLKNMKYPMAGQQSHHVKVGVFNINNKVTTWLKTGEPLDQYLTNITWDPLEKFIFIAHLNRDQNHLKFIKYDATTGEQLKTLFEETDTEYVEPEHGPYFLPNDPTKFLWFSERDNWDHLYLYNIEGELLKQVTKGNWVVKNILGIVKDGKNVFITSTKDTPIEDHAYKVNLDNSTISKITKESADHQLVYNGYNNCLIDSYSSIEVPSATQIIDETGNNKIELNFSENPIKDYKINPPKIFTIKGENNIDLYCKMILPINFDPNKKYPVVFYVYGGPHDQQVKNRWNGGRYSFWSQYMAQNGFISFTLDNRGSANRGLEFEQATFRKLGTKEIEDQMRGVDYLKSLEYVDHNRIGVFGWSYGGFMTASLMLRTNNAFKVGVGGGAVIDWKFYEVMYTERYMDTPTDNPEGYKEASLLNYVDNLAGKLLLVHGTSDPTVVWENTLEFARKAANLNKPLDYYPYIGHGHGVSGKDAVHLYTKISNYFIDNLIGLKEKTPLYTLAELIPPFPFANKII